MKASSTLSPREKITLAHMWDGLTVKESAQACGISECTVKNARANVINKLGVRGQILACREGLRLGYLEVDRA